MEDNDKIIQPKPNRKSTLRLTQEFNEKYFTQFRKSLSISNFSIMKDDVTNYRPLSEQQLIQVETLSDTEKIELIKLYNTMFYTLENIDIK
jgi:hypothetical protein